ncbi:hypothetical protein A2853_03460 [Candidatus Kaiserbacteria bacterium RIFCSPHIGHO2_01_FULL_55_17]|uniref:Uncharacterized protein n=1 Tax=Candidatus Kaiserbacteria bacterium RIFCSPHIGHO2_01_FULL_55_17 TaxID=1798484 RepID=A0A1F6D968_9BACT|nr:MAG: hypothetical protein A2853_03460 [Candidatus Kaiserbacteria bacterium RIFCSPHIGHO2_01_FULL_55_17]
MDDKVQSELKEIFAGLPRPIQDAITSSDVQKKLRELADTHKLHLDQWQWLENEVMMALLGMMPIEDLQESIKSGVKVPDEVAAELTEAISKIVFEPIRQELERELEHPDAKGKEVSGMDAMRTQTLKEEAEAVVASSVELLASTPTTSRDSSSSSQLAARSSVAPVPPIPPVTPPAPQAPQQTPPQVIPATPPPSPLTEKAVRAPVSGSYKAGEASTVRKDVHDDPYREPPA